MMKRFLISLFLRIQYLLKKSPSLSSVTDSNYDWKGSSIGILHEDSSTKDLGPSFLSWFIDEINVETFELVSEEGKEGFSLELLELVYYLISSSNFR